jgi:type I restriction enzyme R subunit
MKLLFTKRLSIFLRSFQQKRVPEVCNQNENLSDEFYQILEDKNIDDQGQEKLEKEFAQELEVIKRDERLETIAGDIVAHFPKRGYLGKGMVVSVDKFTTVKMCDKVQRRWKDEIKRVIGEIGKTSDNLRKKRLEKTLDFMRSVEMAVIVSEKAGEEGRFIRQRLDIKPYRDKMNEINANEINANGWDIESRFKDPNDRLQLIFLCAMWLTGFDAPTVSTVYLDKPMKDHTLMQAIARANRVTSHTINGVTKKNGKIVDYYNVFRNLEKALSVYAVGVDKEEEQPVLDKSNLFVLLDDAVAQGVAYCRSLDIELQRVLEQGGAFNKIQLFEGFADKLLAKDQYWKEFKVYENMIASLAEACQPEILEANRRPLVSAFQYLRGVVEAKIGKADIDTVKQKNQRPVRPERHHPPRGDSCRERHARELLC